MRYLLWSVILTAVLTTIVIISRPLLPVDETRYLSVAWEAHQRHDYLVSHLNGQPYSHKPPLLFWLINAVWLVADVNGPAARMVAPAAAVVCLVLTRILSRRLWPNEPTLFNCAPVVHVTTMLWIVFCPLTMFDTLLTLWTMTALLGVLLASEGMRFQGWLLTGLGIGLGILSKGPVVLVHVLPAAILAPWWSHAVRLRPLAWYLGCFASILLAAAMALAWALPSAASGGEAYSTELLFGQTAGRMVNSFAHRAPFWWYLPWLPLCLMPWISFGAVWRGFSRTPLDHGIKFLICWAGGSLLTLSLVSGKQIYYLIPMIPACAILLTRLATSAVPGPSQGDLVFIVPGTVGMGLLPLVFNHFPELAGGQLSNLVSDAWCIPLVACGLVLLIPRWTKTEWAITSVGTCAIAFISIVVWSISGNVWEGFNLKPLASHIVQAQRLTAWFGEYHGQINFVGALDSVTEVVNEKALRQWLITNPDGLVVFQFSESEKAWADVILPLRAVDRQVLTPEQQQTISTLLQNNQQFPLANLKPQVHYVQRIRRGLTLDLTVVVSYSEKAGLADSAIQDQAL